MAQQSWTLRTDTGKRHVIGLYHGEQSGHLMAYCNNQVILIDFQVLDAKQYSFFVDDDLCELHIKRMPAGTFEYKLLLNREADTPKNLQIKAREEAVRQQRRESMRHSMVAVLALLIIPAMLFWMMQCSR